MIVNSHVNDFTGERLVWKLGKEGAQVTVGRKAINSVKEKWGKFLYCSVTLSVTLYPS